jgi:hypothetical protein
MSWSTLNVNIALLVFLQIIILLMNIDWLTISKSCVLEVSYFILHKTQA